MSDTEVGQLGYLGFAERNKSFGSVWSTMMEQLGIVNLISFFFISFESDSVGWSTMWGAILVSRVQFTVRCLHLYLNFWTSVLQNNDLHWIRVIFFYRMSKQTVDMKNNHQQILRFLERKFGELWMEWEWWDENETLDVEWTTKSSKEETY